MTAPEDQNGLREALAREDLMVRLYAEGRTLREIAPIVSLTHGINLTHGGVQAALRRRGVALRKKARRPDLPRSPKRKDWKYRALAAEAEITRLNEGMEALGAKAEGQITYWRERQAAEKALEDGVSEDGLTYTPMGDHAAWQAGYCNGRMSEADWWRWTLKSLATLSPKEQP